MINRYFTVNILAAISFIILGFVLSNYYFQFHYVFSGLLFLGFVYSIYLVIISNQFEVIDGRVIHSELFMQPEEDSLKQIVHIEFIYRNRTRQIQRTLESNNASLETNIVKVFVYGGVLKVFRIEKISKKNNIFRAIVFLIVIVTILASTR